MTTTPSHLPSRKVGSLVASSLRSLNALWLMGLFAVVFSFSASSTFPTTTTIRIILTNEVTIGLISIAVLVPLVAGTFDLAVGASLGFGMVLVSKLSQSGWNPVVASVVAVAACTAMGWVSGLIVVRLHVNSFIATLGVSQLLGALTLLISRNNQIVGVFPSWFNKVTTNEFLGVSLDVYYLVLIAAIVWYVLEHTPVGRSLFATGGNPEAARLSGLATDRLVWGSLVFSAGLSGLAGVLLASRLQLFSTQFGPSYLFPAFAAVFFGATQIKGRPNVWGTLLAMYSLAVGVTGLELTFFGSEYWIDPLFQGSALLIAVALASRQIGGRPGRWRIKRAAPPEGSESETAGTEAPEALALTGPPHANKS